MHSRKSGGDDETDDDTYETDDDNQVLGPTVCIAGSRVVTAHGNTVRRWDFWKYQVVVMMVIMVMVMVI